MLLLGEQVVMWHFGIIKGMVSLALLGATAEQPRSPAEKRVFVDGGRPVGVVYAAAPWEVRDGALSATGNDRWLLAKRGLVEGDFHITARLSVEKLRHSAARFSFDMQHSFGFEGNHGRIYITNLLHPKNRGNLASMTPAEAGIKDGTPFTFEVVRRGNRIRFLVNAREIHAVDVPCYTFDCFGFDPRRGTIRLEDFAAEGHFAPTDFEPKSLAPWHHPKATLVETPWHGPFVNLPGDVLLTVVNVEGGIGAFASADDGKTWQPRGRIEKSGETFQIRDGNGDTLLLRTRSGVLLCAFLNIFGERISWDYKRQEPLPDMQRFTWVARSDDDGRTWRDVDLVQRGFCGALRDMIQLSTGEIVLVGQNVANNPGRNLSLTYVSTDDGKTWSASNVMDIGGTGDHAGSIEGTLEELRDGRLWILLRSYHGHFYECFSSDKGRTWSAPVASAIKASGSPGILRRLHSGRLVLLWNRFAKDRPRRVGRREELSMAFSEDDGKTWSTPVIVLRERNRRQSYPQVFERRPGELWISTWQGRMFIKLKEQDFTGKPAATSG